MKRAFTIILVAIMLMLLAGYTQADQNNVFRPEATPDAVAEHGGEESGMTNITIEVGDAVFPGKLYDNIAARELLALFPMTLSMSDLNGNEKYDYLDGNLPAESTERPETIHAGEIMCWSDNCLVLFYETFSNSYGGYVRLGYVEDASGLAAALGHDIVQVSLAVSD